MLKHAKNFEIFKEYFCILYSCLCGMIHAWCFNAFELLYTFSFDYSVYKRVRCLALLQYPLDVYESSVDLLVNKPNALQLFHFCKLLLCLDAQNNTGAIDMKINGSVLEEKYCCHVLAGVPYCYLEMLDKLQKQICRAVSPLLAASLELLAHWQNVTNLHLFYRYYFGRCLSELAELVPLSYFQGRSNCYSDRFYKFLGVTRISMSTLSFLA